jgi:photosystem II stability/assembly factor-like uncharacterized protein
MTHVSRRVYAVAVFVVLLLVASTSSFAQWIPTNGPYGGRIDAVVALDDDVWAGNESGILHSSDRGATWSLQQTFPVNLIGAMTRKGTTLYAGVQFEVYRNTDGLVWTKLAASPGFYIRDVRIVGSTIYVGGNGGLVRSTDDGATWQQLYGGFVFALVEQEGDLYVCSFGGLYRSTDDGVTWTNLIEGLPENERYCTGVFVSGSTIMVNAGGLRRSTDNGTTWTKDADYVSRAFLQTPMGVIAELPQGLCRTTDDGATWTTLGGKGLNVTSLTSAGSMIYAGTASQGLFSSADDGVSWTQAPFINASAIPWMMTERAGNVVYAALRGGGLYTTTDNGESWNIMGSPFMIEITSLVFVDDVMVAGMWNEGGIHRSTDGGASWNYVSSTTSGLTNSWIQALRSYDGKVYAATWGGGIFVSDDKGETWKPFGLAGKRIRSFVKHGDRFYAGVSQDGPYVSDDNGVTWKAKNTNLPFITPQSFAFLGSDVFMSSTAGVHRSSDNAESWDETEGDLPELDVMDLAVVGTTILAATYGKGVVRSTDRGQTWQQFGSELANTKTTCLYVSSSFVFAGTQGAGIFRMPLSTVSVDQESVHADHLQFQCVPHPVSNTATLFFTLVEPSMVTLIPCTGQFHMVSLEQRSLS